MKPKSQQTSPLTDTSSLSSSTEQTSSPAAVSSNSTSSDASVNLDRSHDETHKSHHVPPPSIRTEPPNTFTQQNPSAASLSREGSKTGPSSSNSGRDSSGGDVARSSNIPIGQQNYGESRHQQPYSRGSERRDVIGGRYGRGEASGGPPGNETEDSNDAVFSPSSMDDERMMIIEKVSVL